MKKIPAKTVLAENLDLLMKNKGWSNRTLASKCDISDRMIGMILKESSSVTIEKLNIVAKPFGLEGWQLLIPGLKLDQIEPRKLTKLVTNYTATNSEGRKYIDRVAEKEANYKEH